MSHATAAAGRRRLRFGVMCQGLQFPAWQARCLRALLAVDGVEPALLIVDAGAEHPPAPHRLLRRLTGPHALWHLYQRWCVAGRVAAELPVDLGAELAAVPAIRCRAELRGKWSQHFSAEDVATIRGHRLDFVLRFAFNIIRGDVLGAARLGVWSFHHGDLDRYRGLPACFWEVAEGNPITGVTLQRLTDTLDGGVVLRRCYYGTILKSYPRNRDAVLQASVDLPASVCRDLLAGRGACVSAPPSRTTAPIYRAPTNRQMPAFLARQAAAKLADAVRWLFRHRQWCVGIVEEPIHAFLRPGFRPVVRWLGRLDRRRFVADPFGLRRGATTTVLAEEFDQREQVGRLVAIEWPDGGTPVVSRGVLPLPVHASYPFLVEHEGEIFCVPETERAGDVALFRATEFPGRWERVATILAGVAALDPSLVRHEDRWWMFYGVKGASGEVRLHAAHAPRLEGPWDPHQANPLKIDVRSTRPGGTPFVHEGVLYRPAQDGTRGYGGAVALNRVTRLSPTEFEEEVVAVATTDPGGPYPAGMHTLSAVGDWTLVDGQRVLFVPSLFVSQVRRLSRRLRGAVAGLL